MSEGNAMKRRAPMYWILVVVGSLVGLAALLFIIGACLPKRHQFTRAITLKQSPEAVFALLDDVQGMLQWNSNLVKIDGAPDVNGKPATRQTFKGGMAMTIVTSERDPPRRLVRTMVDDGGPYFGGWSYTSLMDASYASRSSEARNYCRPRG